MKRLLLIKLTSLGDLIHALPALTDAYRAFPDLQIDWMIDVHFSEVASWHPAVKQIFKTNHRLWRKNLKGAWKPIRELIHTVRQTEYDLVIDGQGNFKSALLTLFMKGPKAGFDFQSVREPIASFAYQQKYSASKTIHAIDRLRLLFAQSLHYPCPSSPPDFLIDQSRFLPVDLPEKYVVFIHSAAWKTKLWPEEHGTRLIELLTRAGFTVLLPWGNAMEKERAQRLAIHPQAIVLPKLCLSEMGTVIAQSQACICMDTGLSHLAAALNVPSVVLYGATDSGLIGSCGKNHIHLQSTLSCAPCNKKECRLPPQRLNPPCLAALTPEQVFECVMTCIDPQASNTCNKLSVRYTER